MVRGANSRGQYKGTASALKPVARDNYVARTPKTTGYTSTAARLGGSRSNEVSYERTWRTKLEDRDSGSFERYTTREMVSSRDPYKERGSGRVGVKDEFKRSSTTKIGDKRGYTEYYTEERIRNVSYGNGSYNYGSKNQGNAGLGNGSYNYGSYKQGNAGLGNGSYNYGSNNQLPAYENHYDYDSDGDGTGANDDNDIQSDSKGDGGSYDEGQSYGDDSAGGEAYSDGGDDSVGGEAYSDGAAGSYDDDVQSYGYDSAGSYQSYGGDSDYDY